MKVSKMVVSELRGAAISLQYEPSRTLNEYGGKEKCNTNYGTREYKYTRPCLLSPFSSKK